ncbi:MAG TPA: tRNA (adenosine(37)-N6)-dimethylallyltransferase MiaA [Paludibacteraceae bacterium]|nr:tRNA (adenosine(37)-N6)-dimethylallyltransferase MiaA [Paludibacteraceae bacterium]
MNKKLIVLLGPTGIGKTDLSLNIAEHFGIDIISCDSRQFFKEMKIGTAAPTEEQLKRAKHHFIGFLSINDYYSCGKFELDALKVIDEQFSNQNLALMTGGSMLYIDAVCKGIDELPEIDQELRNSLNERYSSEGIANMWAELKLLDPEYANVVDPKNYKRIIHALEICLISGKPYSSIRKDQQKERNFDIIKIGLEMPREELYARINQRVENMMAEGLLEEAQSLYPHRDLNALNTVGYKELFNYFDGEWTLDYARDMIKQNTRHYAKKQLSWFHRDTEINWFHPSAKEEVIQFIENRIKQ